MAIVVGAGVGAYFLFQQPAKQAKFSDDSFNVISRVNTEGSGIYIKESVLTARSLTVDDFFIGTGDNRTVDASVKSAWAGLIWGVPNVQSIQYVQMAQLAQKMGLQFQAYVSATYDSSSTTTMYFETGVANADTATVAKASIIDGGILWQPQYEKIIKTSGWTQLELTNNFDKDHACCVVIGSHKYISENKDVTTRVLGAYIQAVNYVSAAMANHTLDSDDNGEADYNEIVQIGMAFTGFTIDIVEDALADITYLFSDDNTSGSLSLLQSQAESLIGSLSSLGIIDPPKDKAVVADGLVDDSYLTSAVAYTPLATYDLANVGIGVIAGDIHQIAVHVANSKGFFTTYGIDATLTPIAGGGSNVAAQVVSGGVTFGLLGLPPATITTINSGLITA